MPGLGGNRQQQITPDRTTRYLKISQQRPMLIGSCGSRNPEESHGKTQQFQGFSFFRFLLCFAEPSAAVCLYRTASFARCGSHGTTTAAVPPRLLFVTSSAPVGMRMCTYVCVPSRQQATWYTITARNSSEFQKHPRSTAAVARAAAPRHQRTSYRLPYIEPSVFPRFNLRDPPGVQTNHIPKGNLVFILICTKYTFFTSATSVCSSGRGSSLEL